MKKNIKKAFLFIFLIFSSAFLCSCNSPAPERIGPAPDTYELKVLSSSNQINIDGVSYADITVSVQKNGRVVDSLPPGWQLYAYHNFSGSKLVVIDQVENKYVYTGTSNPDLYINELSPVCFASGVPVDIKCKVNSAIVGKEMYLELEITDPMGSVIYTYKINVNSSATEYVFDWNGFTLASVYASAGKYQAVVKLKDNSGGTPTVIKTSNIVPIYLKGEIGVFETTIPCNAGQSKMTLTSPPDCDHWQKDEIFVALKRADGIQEASNISAPLKIMFVDQSLYRVSPSPIPAFVLDCTLDGFPATVSFPGTGGGVSYCEVIAYKGDLYKQVTYRLSMYTKDIQVIDAKGTAQLISYTDGAKYKDVGCVIVDLMNKIFAESFAGIGVKRDASGNISITKDLHGAVSNIKYYADDKKYVITLSGKGSGKYTFDLDLTSGSLRTQGEGLNQLYSINADEFDIWLTTMPSDYFYTLPDVGGVVGAGVKAQSIDMSALQKLIGLAVIAPSCLANTSVLIEQEILLGMSWKETLYPKNYAGPVKVTGGYPFVNTSNLQITGLDFVKGEAPPFCSVQTVFKGASYYTYANSMGEWMIDDDIYNINYGENRLNYIAYNSDGCEVESGDITVYRGNPSFAVLQPADREVVWGDVISNGKLNCQIKLTGIATQGTEAKIRFPENITSPSFYANNNWKFKDSGGLFAKLTEGENQIQIIVGGVSITRTIIAAHKYENSSVGKKYVLRKGDMLFCSKNDSDFDVVAKEPDHVAVYIGGAGVSESWMDSVKGVWMHPIGSGNPDFTNSHFYYAAQPKMPVGEAIRSQVAAKAISYSGDGTYLKTPYDSPFAAPVLNNSAGQKRTLNILCHYDGEKNGFYCSELVYYCWEWAAKQFGSSIIANIGMDKSKMMWPFGNIDSLSAILPAKLGFELMECIKY